MNAARRPFYAFIFFGIICGLLSFRKSGTADFHFHDTYVVMPLRQLYWFLALAAVVLWIVNRLFARLQPVRWLSYTHIVASLLALIALLLYPCFSPLLQYESTVDEATLEGNAVVNMVLTISFVAGVVIGILAFAINLLAGAIEKSRK